MQRSCHLYTLVQRSTKAANRNFAQLCKMPYPGSRRRVLTTYWSAKLQPSKATGLHFEMKNRELSQVTLQVGIWLREFLELIIRYTLKVFVIRRKICGRIGCDSDVPNRGTGMGDDSGT